MNDIINISKADVSFLKFTSLGSQYPKSLSSSEDGFLSILYHDAIVVGTIGFKPLSEEKKYIFNQENIEVDVKSSERIIDIAAFNFMEVINSHQVSDGTIYNLALSENYTAESNNKKANQGTKFSKFCRVEWSPLNTLVNKSYLAVMNYDGRITIFGQNKNTNKWEKEHDLLQLYHQYYKDNLLTSSYNVDGKVDCKSILEYTNLKNDLKLISFNWSSLTRMYKLSQYCLIVLLSDSGLLTIWSQISSQSNSACQVIYHFRVNCTSTSKPKLVQFCDISQDQFLILVTFSDERVVAYCFSILTLSDKSSKISISQYSNEMTIHEKSRFTQPNKQFWSMKYSTLIVGYESELLFIRIDVTPPTDHVLNQENSSVSLNNEAALSTKCSSGVSCSSYWLELPSSEEVSGIVAKDNIVYVTTHDGYLFGIRLDTGCADSSGFELNEIVFESPELSANVEFLDVFVSTNGVHFGLLSHTPPRDSGGKTARPACDIVLIRSMPEKELLNILMDENRPFCRKQDAVEELRHLYHNSRHMLHAALQKLVRSEHTWDDGSLHNLQLARYLCILFGYRLNVNHELGDIGARHLDFTKIRRLESIMIRKNIGYWLESFVSAQDLGSEDCFYVIGLVLKLGLGTEDTISSSSRQTIEEAGRKARTLLLGQFRIDQDRLDAFENNARRQPVCPVCQEASEFNLFALKCPRKHVVPRCCKSLELCTSSLKRCDMCGAVEKYVEDYGQTNFRLEIIHSNCPLCDGRFTKINF